MTTPAPVVIPEWRAIAETENGLPYAFAHEHLMRIKQFQTEGPAEVQALRRKGDGVKGKNMRLLGLEESPNRQPSIQEIIRELQEEIARGESVYTTDELRLLERKLAEYEEMLLNLLGP